jgi:transposase
MAVDLALVDGYDPLLAELERSIEKTAQGHDPVSLVLLRTVPRVGSILALGMRYEIEEIARFPGSKRSSPTGAWSRVPESPTANGMAPAARRSATRTSRGHSRKRRYSFSSITSWPKSTWQRSPPDTAKARPCRSSPTN